jgi:hypothetical protein
MPTYKDSIVAVGRLLRPKGTEPQRHELLKVRPDGTTQLVIIKPLP